MYVPAEKIVENVLTTYFFYNFRLIIQFKTARKLKEGNIKRLQKYKVSEKQVFPCLVSYIYLIVSFLHVYTECNSLYFLSKLQILTLRSLICQNLQRQKLNDRKLTGLKHTRHVS